jgi:hypothetical protein
MPELARHSTFNKTKSPVVEQNTKARANKTTETPFAAEVSAVQSKEKKITKAVGLGRHRSEMPASETRDEQAQTAPQQVQVVEANDDIPSDPLCGCW